MKHVGISGGGTKIVGLYGACLALKDNGFKPDVLSGISAGAILAVLWATDKLRQAEPILNGLTQDTFFHYRPTNWRAIVSVILGDTGLADQSKVKDQLKNLISVNDWNDYTFGEGPACWVGSVDLVTGKRKYMNLKFVTYEHMLELVLASASIPVFTKGVNFMRAFLVDGGVRDHSPTPWVLKNSPGIKTTVSIYSRPKNYQLRTWKPEGRSLKKVLSVLSRTIDVMNVEISKGDEFLEDTICELEQIDQVKIFLPSILKDVYDTDPERLAQLYAEGYRAGSGHFGLMSDEIE